MERRYGPLQAVKTGRGRVCGCMEPDVPSIRERSGRRRQRGRGRAPGSERRWTISQRTRWNANAVSQCVPHVVKPDDVNLAGEPASVDVERSGLIKLRLAEDSGREQGGLVCLAQGGMGWRWCVRLDLERIADFLR